MKRKKNSYLIGYHLDGEYVWGGEPMGSIIPYNTLKEAKQDLNEHFGTIEGNTPTAIYKLVPVYIMKGKQ